MTSQTEKIHEELTIEQLTAVIGEIPFVMSLGEGQEYSGPPNKRLAFSVSEELGLEGAAALLRFATMCMKFAQIGGPEPLPPHESGPNTPKGNANETPLTALLENSINDREKAMKEKKGDTEGDTDATQA